jgi:hypothetical protein
VVTSLVFANRVSASFAAASLTSAIGRKSTVASSVMRLPELVRMDGGRKDFLAINAVDLISNRRIFNGRVEFDGAE